MNDNQASGTLGMAVQVTAAVAVICWLIVSGYLWWGLAGALAWLMMLVLEEETAWAGICASLLAAAFVYTGAYGMAFFIQVPLVVILHGIGYYWSAGLSGAFFVLALTGCYLHAPDPVHVASKSTQQVRIVELGEHVERWKESRSQLRALATKLEQERLDLLRQLDRRGVNSPGASAADPRAKVLLAELRDVLRQQSLVRGKHDQYDLAILKAEAQLRSIERRVAAEGVGINDAELSQLARLVIDLDESVAAEAEVDVPVELDKVLAEQLTGQRSVR